jgi:DNA polymerase/3'-5' exonuclease PolX
MDNANKTLARILEELAFLLDVKGIPFKPAAYRKAAASIEKTEASVKEIYKNGGIKALKKIPGVGSSIAEKIEEYIKKKKIKLLDQLKKETAIRQIVTHYFETKGVDLGQLKQDAKRRTIVYRRYTRSAKELIQLAGSVELAKEAIDKVAVWAKTRKLDYALETVIKKWLELDQLKPKETVKKPFYLDDPMIWSEAKKKWYVISKQGEWLEYADKIEKIEWRTAK